ncbi:hypothetical protein BC941DRAFT_464649 [Chlamydoabsidia padenii]|nr:hypothetical protein BC941DRAFT_464649 [Chlamydoabsidia padenii]
MLSSLPLELFDLINQYLSPQDKYRCLFVCQAWYPSFRLSLYQHCNIITTQSYRSFYTSLQNGQASGLGGQVRVLDTSRCELTLQDIKSLFQLCPNIRDTRFRWHPSYIYDGDGNNNDHEHDYQVGGFKISRAQNVDCQQHMWNHQITCPDRSAIDTNITDEHRQQYQRPTSTSHLLLCGYLTQLTLHDADLGGLFSLVIHLPLLEQLQLISVKLDIALDDIEQIHTTCPRLTSLSLDIHTLLSTSPKVNNKHITHLSTYLCNLPMMNHMQCLRLVYKYLEKPGRSPWIQYLAHKYPKLASLEMQTRFVHRRNYWQWNRVNNNVDNEGLVLQRQDQGLENMEDHPDFRAGLKQWAQSCRHLTRIHFAGIPWDRWFLKHLPTKHHPQQQPTTPATTDIQRPSISQPVKHIHVVRVDDDLNAAAATFATLVNHPSLNQLGHLTLRPVATNPDDSFYKALGQLGSLTSLTIQQQGIRSNKLSPCQVDILRLLVSCPKLQILTIGGMAVSSTMARHQTGTHKHLLSLNLSTTNINHTTLQHILSYCPSLTRFYFISCVYEAALEHGIPTLSIDHPEIQWKEVHIRYPFIQSPQTQQYHQPIGLSGRRTPRFLNISQQQDDRWIYLIDETRQKSLDLTDIGTIMGQMDHSLRQEGLEFGRIKVVCHSIQSLCINGTRIRF